MDNVYALPGDAFQIIGGECPEGWVVMQDRRPTLDHVANASGGWVLPPPAVPNSVSALQGMLALNAAGHLQAVEAIFNDDATSLVYRLAWQRAQTWDRDSPTVAYMEERMAWDGGYIDHLFIAAQKVKG